MDKVTFKSIGRKLSNHVRVEINGKFPEKFINICIKRGVDLWNVEMHSNGTYHVNMKIKDFKHKIRSAALKTKCRVHVLERSGAGVIIYRYRRRLPLLCGSVLIAAAVWFSFTLLWSVEVSGGRGEDIVAANKILENMGIIPGVSVKSIDIKEISETVESGIEGVDWVGVKIDGSKLTVTLSNGTYFDGTEVDPHMPCDIVAEKDAYITKIIAKQGTVVVPENSVVLKGSTIISGVVLPINEMFGTEERYVHAMGEVTGVVRYSSYRFIEESAEVFELTGNTAEVKNLLIFGFKIPLPWCKIKDVYENYDSITVSSYVTFSDGSKLPFGIATETLMETSFTEKIFTEEEAISYAELQAMAELDGKIPDDAEVVDTGHEIREIDGRKAFYIWAECVEEIGVMQRIE
ncbi:MAG: sporulation protein YqfD [Clostridia bacterium]|nr:sporulation protein YqfD [Clostridia bacterium]